MGIRVTERQLHAYGIFRKHGLHRKGSGAVVGNLVQESGRNLDSTMYRARPDASGGIRRDLRSGGIAEWLGDRKLACIAFSRGKEERLGMLPGALLNDLETQCEFVTHELKFGESGNNPSQYAELWRQLTTETLNGSGKPRSIATLTANFMTMYERPKMGAGTDKLGEVRIPYAEAVAGRYERIEKAEEPKPQPAPPTPLPQVPGPYTLPPALPPPTAPARPPVPASTAGRQAAIYDVLYQTRGNLLAERASIDAEIVIIDSAIASFEKLAPVPAIDAPPRALPPPTAEDSAQPPAVGINKMFGRSWKTSMFGAGSIGGAVATIAAALISGQPLTPEMIIMALSAISAGAVGLTAKDAAVTGGTISAKDGTFVPLDATVPNMRPRRDV